jgi:hypothetical protein
VNAIQKQLFGLKNVLQRPHKAFQRILRWIYQALRKTWCRYVACFAIHCRQKRYTKSEKRSCTNNVCSERCHVAEWRNRLSEVWPWPFLSLSFTKAITTITVPNFPYHPILNNVFSFQCVYLWVDLSFRICTGRFLRLLTGSRLCASW